MYSYRVHLHNNCREKWKILRERKCLHNLHIGCSVEQFVPETHARLYSFMRINSKIKIIHHKLLFSYFKSQHSDFSRGRTHRLHLCLWNPPHLLAFQGGQACLWVVYFVCFLSLLPNFPSGASDLILNWTKQPQRLRNITPEPADGLASGTAQFRQTQGYISKEELKDSRNKWKQQPLSETTQEWKTMPDWQQPICQHNSTTERRRHSKQNPRSDILMNS